MMTTSARKMHRLDVGVAAGGGRVGSGDWPRCPVVAARRRRVANEAHLDVDGESRRRRRRRTAASAPLTIVRLAAEDAVAELTVVAGRKSSANSVAVVATSSLYASRIHDC